MDEEILQNLKQEIEKHCEIHIKSLTALGKGGSTSFTQIAETYAGNKYIVKLKYVNSDYIYYINTLYALNELNDIIPFCLNCFIFQSGILCIVTEWTDGENVDYECDNIQQLDTYAQGVADCLKKLHSFPIKKGGRVYNIESEIQYSIDNLQKYHIVIPHMEEYLDYLKNVEDIYYTTERNGYIHFDFHMQNIIKCGVSDYRLIDCEIVGISDIWRDLVYAVCINYPDEQNFWLLFLFDYFNDNIPKDFFKVTKFYVVLFMLMLAKSNYIKGTLENYFMLVEKVFNEYKSLKCAIPFWMKKTAEKLIKSDKKHIKQLKELIRLIDEERGINENSNTK